MGTRIGWTLGVACMVLAGFAPLRAPAQDPKPVPGQEVRKDRKDLEASRQQLRAAYKSGDPAAIKAARENYQKHRGELRGDHKDRDLGASTK